MSGAFANKSVLFVFFWRGWGTRFFFFRKEDGLTLTQQGDKRLSERVSLPLDRPEIGPIHLAKPLPRSPFLNKS